MKWLQVYDKLAKQPVRITRSKDVTVLVDGKEILVTDLKFKNDGTPYFITDTDKKGTH